MKQGTHLVFSNFDEATIKRFTAYFLSQQTDPRQKPTSEFFNGLGKLGCPKKIVVNYTYRFPSYYH